MGMFARDPMATIRTEEFAIPNFQLAAATPTVIAGEIMEASEAALPKRRTRGNEHV